MHNTDAEANKYGRESIGAVDGRVDDPQQVGINFLVTQYVTN